MSTQKRNLWRLLALVSILALVLAACGGGNQSATETPAGAVTEPAGGAVTPEMTEAATMEATAEMTAEATAAMTAEATAAMTAEATAAMTAEATSAATASTGGAANLQQIGGTVTVMGVWGGAELDNFLAMVAPFEQATGVKVEFEGTRDINAVLATRIQGGNPPDVAGLPNPGTMQEYVQQGVLQPLDDVVDMNRLGQEYPEGFLNLGKVNDQTYGVFIKASVKSLIWYRPDIFDQLGYKVPTTWEELQALEQQIIDSGKTPWCIGMESGAASGWPGTDWIEDIMLRTGGVEAYDNWWQHKIPWTDQAVSNAWDTWGKIVGDEKMVYGGPTYVLSTNFGNAPFPMFDPDPGCFLHRQASFITTFVQDQYPNIKLGENFNFFPFPPIDEAQGNPLLVAGDLFGMFNDTPQARALMDWLTTADAQQIWAEKGGYIAPNQKVPTSVYPEDITRQAADMYVKANEVRFDASDLMPQAVQDAFTQGILQFIQDTGSLQSVLENIESAAQGAYGQQ